MNMLKKLQRTESKPFVLTSSQDKLPCQEPELNKASHELSLLTREVEQQGARLRLLSRELADLRDHLGREVSTESQDSGDQSVEDCQS